MKKIFLILLLFPSLGLAESTISCHCFQDRTFNHRDTEAADPYFLATTQNSLLAVIYGVNKGNLVKAKMSGANGSYLWILYDLAARTELSPQQIVSTHAAKNNWPTTFATLGFNPEQLGRDYWNAANNPETLANYIVDQHLIRYFNVTSSEIEVWRKHGMSRKEMILGTMLEGTPLELRNQVNSRSKSWGQLLDEQGFKTGKEITRHLQQLITPPS